jgi:hypothetical protein
LTNTASAVRESTSSSTINAWGINHQTDIPHIPLLIYEFKSALSGALQMPTPRL